MKVILTEDEAINLIYAYVENKFGHDTAPDKLNISIEREETVESPVTTKRLKETVRRWAQDGENKITMIKDIRSLTGWGLKESKDFVEENSLVF